MVHTTRKVAGTAVRDPAPVLDQEKLAATSADVILTHQSQVPDLTTVEAEPTHVDHDIAQPQAPTTCTLAGSAAEQLARHQYLRPFFIAFHSFSSAGPSDDPPSR